MPANASTFLLGLAVGSLLLVIGILLGFWFGRRAGAATVPPQGLQFLAFLRTMSQWTSEFSGDILKYQDQLTNINKRVQSGNAPREELIGMVAQMMDTNRQLQLRLENTEKKLDVQTDQLASYLTEARTDALTGLLNRRAFDKSIDELFSVWQRQQTPFCVGLVDIDYFKRINDTHGHPAGDEVLKQVARMIQLELPEAVCVARYGGEEFGVLSMAPAEEFAVQLDKLRMTVGKMQIEYNRVAIRVTLSSGLAQVAPGERIGNLVRRADVALYASKMGGRNQVQLHEGQDCRLISQSTQSSNETPQFISPIQQEFQDQVDAVTNKVQQRLRRIVEEESQRVGER